MKVKQTENRDRNWWSQLVALIALIDLILVLFNFSYLPLRDIYLSNAPLLVKIYDPVKGIEPHPDTETYLATSDRLQEQIPRTGLTTNTELLASLRQQSIFLIEENPFLAANKLGTFAKLKHRMEYRLQTRSAKEAFNRFWSLQYLSNTDTANELAFFNNKIAPLLKVNYYRCIDANGMNIDRFWQIDIFFIVFFAIESQRASMFLIVRLLNQSQEAIANGTIAEVLLSSNEVTVGEADKIDRIVDRLISLTV